MFVPMFPLELVLFPGEELNLHIFEPRYIQLVRECDEHQATFGIPAFVDGDVAEFGTEAAIRSIDKVYDSGEMDIRTVGLRAFHLDTFRTKAPDKLYGGGEVTFIENDPRIESRDLETLKAKFAELHTLLESPRSFSDLDVENLSFRIGHHVGFSLRQKVRLLSMPRERDRQKKILCHLDNILPIVGNLAETKRRIRENGHFKVFPRIVLDSE